ncbi:hypothetical protein ACVWXQ_000751 [Bradyrhizobium sp. S3.14.4]
MKVLEARRRSRQLLERLQGIDLARLIEVIVAALSLLPAFIVEILVSDDFTDGLLCLAGDPLREIFRLAHRQPRSSRR